MERNQCSPPKSSIARRKDLSAYRPRPARDGTDFWPTPPCLIKALVQFALPGLPAGNLWEFAAGDGRVARVLRAAGRPTLRATSIRRMMM
jgi:hypothetical protein